MAKEWEVMEEILHKPVLRHFFLVGGSNEDFYNSNIIGWQGGFPLAGFVLSIWGGETALYWFLQIHMLFALCQLKQFNLKPSDLLWI